MKVLHVYRTYFPDTHGGLEEAVRQICLSTKSHGCEHRIFTLSRYPGPQRLVFPEADVYRASLSMDIKSCGISLTGLALFRNLVDWADIVHYQFPWPFADVLHFLAGVKKPALVTYQSDIVRQKVLGFLYRPLMHRFLGSLDCIVATSDNYLASSKVLQQHRHKVEVIPNCLQDSVSESLPQSLLDRLSTKDDFFLFVGVLRYYKGLHVLLEALEGTNLRCVIAGKGPLERLLRDQVLALGLKHVEFVGYVTDEEKAALMRLCRAVVFPSHLRSEAFGVTLLEGAMYGKPLISCEIGTGTSFINQHDETGIVVPPSDANALRKAMLRIAGDDELALRFGSAARKRYEALFSGPQVGQAYADLYRRLVDRRPVQPDC